MVLNHSIVHTHVLRFAVKINTLKESTSPEVRREMRIMVRYEQPIGSETEL